MRAGHRRAGPLHPRTHEALAGLRAARRQGDRAANRRGWAPFLCCRACGHAWECQECDVSLVIHRVGFPARLPPLRPRGAATRGVPRVRLGDARPRRGRDGATRVDARRDARSAACVPARLRQRCRARPRRDPGRVPARVRGRAARHPDGREGPRLRRRRPQRDPRCRRDAAVPRLSRRGAHVRARRPARWAQRTRWAAGACSCRRWRRMRLRSRRPRGTTPRASCGRARASPGARLSAVLAAGRGSSSAPPMRPTPRPRPRRSPSGSPLRAGRWRERARAGAAIPRSADATAASCWSSRPSASRWSPRSAPPSRPRRVDGGCADARSRSTSIRSEASSLASTPTLTRLGFVADEPVRPQATPDDERPRPRRGGARAPARRACAGTAFRRSGAQQPAPP